MNVAIGFLSLRLIPAVFLSTLAPPPAIKDPDAAVRVLGKAIAVDATEASAAMIAFIRTKDVVRVLGEAIAVDAAEASAAMIALIRAKEGVKALGSAVAEDTAFAVQQRMAAEEANEAFIQEVCYY